MERTGSVIRIFDSSKIKEHCPKHSEIVIALYFNDCSVPCCSKCIEEKHRRHDIITIEKKYMETEDRLNDLVTDLEKNTLKRLQDNIEELWKALNSHEKKFKTVAEMVNKFRNELKNAVDASCDKTLDKLKKIETKQGYEIRSTISNLENQIQQNRSLIKIVVIKYRRGDSNYCNINQILLDLKYHPHLSLRKAFLYLFLGTI